MAQSKEHDVFERISPQSACVLALLMRQYSRREIARSLGIPDSTLRDRIRTLERLTDTSNQHELVRWWIDNRAEWGRWVLRCAELAAHALEGFGQAKPLPVGAESDFQGRRRPAT